MTDNTAIFSLLIVMILSALIGIVVISVIRANTKRSLHAQSLRNTEGMTDLAGENEALRTEVGELRERLHVLERIATDPSERTAREIEALR